MYNLTSNKKSAPISAMVNTNVWRETKELSPAARLAYQFILTCPQRNKLGCFHLPLALIEAHVGVRNAKPQAEAALRELASVGLVSYDHQEEIVAAPGWFKHNRAANVHTPYDARVALAIYSKIPTSSPVFKVFIDLIKQTPLRDKMPTGFGRYSKEAA